MPMNNNQVCAILIALAVVFAAWLCMTFEVMADPSIKVRADGSSHFQALQGELSSGELTLKADDFFISADGAAASGYAEAKMTGVSLEVIPWMTEYGKEGTWSSGTRVKWTVKVTSQTNPNQTCVLRDANGKLYESLDWETLLIWQDNRRLTARVSCNSATLQ